MTTIWGARCALTALAAAMLSGCGAMDAIQPVAGGVTGTLANLVSFGPGTAATPEQIAAGGPKETREIDCPTVEVQDGTSALRVGGPTNDSVRYQFDIIDTARECQIQGSQFAIKVGVAGRLLIGPAGSPGAFSAPVRVVVRQDATGKPVYSKVYKAEANGASIAQSTFQLVSDPIMLPYVHRQAADDYTILVGFDTGAATAAPHAHAHKRRPKQ